MPSLNDMLFYGLDVLDATLDAVSNAYTLVLGDSIGEQSESQGAEYWGMPGVMSVPAPSTPNSPGCQVVGIRQGDRDVVIAARDLRSVDRYANAKPGETFVYATVGQARTMHKADGSVTLYTTDSNQPASEGGKATYLKVSPEDGLQFVAPWGTFVFDKTGLHIRHHSGWKLDAGGVGGLPGPLAALSSYFKVQASVFQGSGSLTLLGSGPYFNPVSYALAENPLTTPGIPILVTFPGAPSGFLTSASVRVSV